jgi:hypothetical protein
MRADHQVRPARARSRVDAAQVAGRVDPDIHARWLHDRGQLRVHLAHRL